MKNQERINKLLSPQGSIVGKIELVKSATTEELIMASMHNPYAKEELERRRYRKTIIMQWIIIVMSFVGLIIGYFSLIK